MVTNSNQRAATGSRESWATHPHASVRQEALAVPAGEVVHPMSSIFGLSRRVGSMPFAVMVVRIWHGSPIPLLLLLLPVVLVLVLVLLSRRARRMHRVPVLIHEMTSGVGSRIEWRG